MEKYKWNWIECKSNQRNVKTAVSALSSTSSSFGSAAASSKFDATNGIDEQLKAQVLAEEEAAMNQYKVIICLLNIKYINRFLNISFSFCLVEACVTNK